MLLWHVAGSVAIFRYVFRDPKVDLRLLAVGAILANLIDKPLALVTSMPPRSVGHSLLLPILGMAVALVFTRRGRQRRLWMAVVIGLFLHLVLDGMWFEPETLLWPALGPFAAYDGPVLPDLRDPWAWAMEAIGLVYLLYLARQSGLSDRLRRRELLRRGRLQG